MNIQEVAVGIVLLALAISFSIKCVEAVFFGRTWFWTGFLPAGIVSPFLLHWSPGEKSLFKKIHSWWIHLLLGPAFFLCALCCFSIGMDKFGFDGTGMVNSVLTVSWLPNTSHRTVEPAITYSKEEGYKFPILGRISTAVFKLLTGHIVGPPDETPAGQNAANQPASNSTNNPPSRTDSHK